MSSVGTRVFVARLAGTTVFDPLGDQVGRVRDVVVLVRPKGAPRAVGLVVESRFASYDLRPFAEGGDYAVHVLRHA